MNQTTHDDIWVHLLCTPLPQYSDSHIELDVYWSPSQHTFVGTDANKITQLIDEARHQMYDHPLLENISLDNPLSSTEQLAAILSLFYWVEATPCSAPVSLLTQAKQIAIQ